MVQFRFSIPHRNVPWWPGISQGQDGRCGRIWNLVRHWDFPYHTSDPWCEGLDIAMMCGENDQEWSRNTRSDLWSEQWDKKAKGTLGELNHDRILGLFYISLILLPFPCCHLFTEINISLVLALLMILMLALPAGMSFKGQRQITRGFMMAILHSVSMKIQKEGAKSGRGEVFKPSSKGNTTFHYFISCIFVSLKRNIYLFLKKNINPGIAWHLKHTPL